MVVWPAVKMATTVAAVFMVSVKVLGVVAPVWPGSDVEEKLIVVLLAAMVRCLMDERFPISIKYSSKDLLMVPLRRQEMNNTI